MTDAAGESGDKVENAVSVSKWLDQEPSMKQRPFCRRFEVAHVWARSLSRQFTYDVRPP
jgi:hypothetical protein